MPNIIPKAARPVSYQPGVYLFSPTTLSDSVPFRKPSQDPKPSIAPSPCHHSEVYPHPPKAAVPLHEPTPFHIILE